MSYIRLGNFFQLYKVEEGREKLQRKYNNITPGRPIRWNGTSYDYVSFIYQGAAKNRTGDNLEAQLVFAVNEISSGIAYEAVSNRWHVRVYSAVVTPNGDISRILTTEEWLATSLSYDTETIEVILSSAIDAVGANAPTRVLTRKMVGRLPITANINTQ